MKNTIKSKWLQITGAILILTGALSIFPENDTLLHTSLQVTFVIGCIMFLVGGLLAKKSKNSSYIIALVVLLTLPGNISAQDYNQQTRAFEESFQKKDVSIVKPFVSDSLKFLGLPIQNTMPILNNIVTKLPKLNGIELLNVYEGGAKVKYDFEQLGVSESEILFDGNGKIIKIEFVDNLVKQQIEQQRKMQSSIQSPQPEKIAFEYSKVSIEFPSEDGLIVSADLYETDPKKPTILLCHQAGYNKYEYADIAPRLNKMGFNVLAIDQRSGGTFADKENETFIRATKNDMESIEFTDAIQDIQAAIKYLADKYNQKVILWGSSYSSSLALHIAAENKQVKAVISFSPGDYFGKKLPSLKTVIPEIKQPFLVTSSRDEAVELKALLSDVNQNDQQLQFIPESEGFHGSRALWVDQSGAEEYWAAVNSFLSEVSQ